MERHVVANHVGAVAELANGPLERPFVGLVHVCFQTTMPMARSSKRQAFVDLLVGDGERRRDPHGAAGRARPHEIGRQADIHGGFRDRIGDAGRVARADVGELDTAQQTAAADIADAGMALLQAQQPGREMLAGLGGALGQPVALHDLEDFQPDRGGQRVVHMRRVEEEVPLVGDGGDFLVGHDGGQGPSRIRVLDSVRMSGTTPSRSNANIVARAAEPGLRLVEDQQHPARLAVRLQGGEVAQREVDDAAAAREDRLGDEGRQVARALGVDLDRSSIVKLPAPVEGSAGGSGGR